MPIRFLSLLTPLALLALPAQATILLTVDLSETNQITISATTGASAASAFGSSNTGFYLANLFGSSSLDPFVFGPQSGSNLTAASNTPNNMAVLARFPQDPGLNIYDYTSVDTSSFTENQQAFTGSATWTIPEAHYNAVVSLGLRSGNIYFPASRLSQVDSATLIGQWEVTAIPEPRAAAFVLALGAVGLVVARRRKRVG